MKKHKLLLFFFWSGCFAFSSLLNGCSKDDDGSGDKPPFLGVKWKASYVDPHPEKTTPAQLNFPWLDCNTDDVFTFGKDNRLHIDFGDVDCDDGQSSVLSELQNEDFSYDEENQKLTAADGTVIRITYLSKTSLKLAPDITKESGYANQVFIFEKK